ncbi:hypothetical protein RND81_09G055700 [Saponaria officinalis]|uniref:MULE transposase domain-containing protein n=1 Tax=Saponaria officinalis TaxID=3572 RepID=A0AAW1II75_SAPOF
MSTIPDLNEIFHEEIGENQVDDGDNIIQTAANLLTSDNEPPTPTEQPSVGMEFDSGDEYAAFCYTYAYKSGFELQIRSNKILKHFADEGISRGGSGTKEPKYFMMRQLRFQCNSANKIVKNAPQRRCKFFVDARVNDSGKFRIGTCDLSHTHDLIPEGSRHSINYRHIGEYFKTRMMLNERAGIPITRNYNALAVEAGGFANLPFTPRDMRNVINKERRLSRLRGDTQQVIDHFKRLKALDERFYFAYEVDEDEKILSLFWANARCCAMYEAFGDPSSFDTTFGTNRSLLSFCPFVGVNHHGSTIVYAATLISYEDMESFEFVFRNWINCMGRAPSIIVTDECKGIEGAINSKFPDAKHRLCLWHVLQNFDKNLKDEPQFPQIDRDFRMLVHECYTEEELVETWRDFLDKYNLHQNTWLIEKWAKRRRWVPLY